MPDSFTFTFTYFMMAFLWRALLTEDDLTASRTKRLFPFHTLECSLFLGKRSRVVWKAINHLVPLANSLSLSPNLCSTKVPLSRAFLQPSPPPLFLHSSICSSSGNSRTKPWRRSGETYKGLVAEENVNLPSCNPFDRSHALSMQ